MANYRYLGYGITDENGIATLDHDANGDPITHSYTGTGAGELDIIASLDDSSHISDSSIQSETFVTYDCIVVEDELTSSKSYNIALNDIDFYLEFTVNPSSDSNRAFLQIGDSSRNLQIGDLYTNANAGINWTNGTFYGKSIATNTDTKITVTRTGTNVILTVGDSAYNISDMNITCTTLKGIIIGGETMKDFKIYPI